MTFREYQEEAIKTKIYRDEIAIPYIVLGASSEIGELLTAIEFAKNNPDNIVKEAGDCFWYIAMACHEFGISTNNLKFSPHPLGLVDLIREVNSSLSRLSGYTKKYLRDDYPDTIDKNRLKNILSEIQFLYCAIQSIVCAFSSISIEEVWKMNIDKLKSRKERGVLSGSGDNR